MHHPTIANVHHFIQHHLSKVDLSPAVLEHHPLTRVLVPPTANTNILLANLFHFHEDAIHLTVCILQQHVTMTVIMMKTHVQEGEDEDQVQIHLLSRAEIIQ